MILNRQEGDHGAVIRSLPLKLEEALPLVLQPGQAASVWGSVAAEGRLRIVSEAKSQCFVDGKAWSEELLVPQGNHAVWLRNEGAKSATFTLVAEPPPAAPQLDPESRKALGIRLPALSESSPLFLDLGVQEQRTALLSVKAPGLCTASTRGS